MLRCHFDRTGSFSCHIVKVKYKYIILAAQTHLAQIYMFIWCTFHVKLNMMYKVILSESKVIVCAKLLSVFMTNHTRLECSLMPFMVYMEPRLWCRLICSYIMKKEGLYMICSSFICPVSIFDLIMSSSVHCMESYILIMLYPIYKYPHILLLIAYLHVNI